MAAIYTDSKEPRENPMRDFINKYQECIHIPQKTRRVVSNIVVYSSLISAIIFLFIFVFFFENPNNNAN